MASSKAKRLLSSIGGGYSNSDENDSGNGYDEDKIAVAEEVLAAIKKGDAEALCEALETLICLAQDDADDSPVVMVGVK